jgi:serine protease Do
VKLQDGRELQGKLVGADPATDLAVVKIDAPNLPVATLGNSDTLEVGETVIAIGNPFGLEQTVTQGIVSAKGRSQVGLTDYEDFIQTDASINPGNSGGPLINLKGEIVGVNTAIFSRSGGSMGIGFSIPVNMARSIMQSLIQSGRVVRGFLGVVIQDVTQELADAMGVKVNEGVLIANVGPNTPAAAAGMKQGDIVVHFNGHPVKSSNELRNAVAATKPGKQVPMDLMREGKPLRLMVTIAEQPQDMRAAIEGPKPEGEHGPGAGPGPGGRPEEALGMQVEVLTPDLAERLGYQDVKGVVVSAVAPNSPAADAGLRRGTLIESVNRKTVVSVQEFRTEISRVPSGKRILLLARFGGANQFVVIKKP